MCVAHCGPPPGLRALRDIARHAFAQYSHELHGIYRITSACTHCEYIYIHTYTCVFALAARRCMCCMCAQTTPHAASVPRARERALHSLYVIDTVLHWTLPHPRRAHANQHAYGGWADGRYQHAQRLICINSSSSASSRRISREKACVCVCGELLH